jgi:hypothetical protein
VDRSQLSDVLGVSMAHIVIEMPRGGEDGVIIATYVGIYRHWTVEFRGRPYSQWEIGEDTPMYRFHSTLFSTNISDFQNGEPQVLTPWNKEWNKIRHMVISAGKYDGT